MAFLLSWQQDEHPLSSMFSHLLFALSGTFFLQISTCIAFFPSDLSLSVPVSETHALTILSNRTEVLYLLLFSFKMYIITWQSICFLMQKKIFIVCSPSKCEICENRGIVGAAADIQPLLSTKTMVYNFIFTAFSLRLPVLFSLFISAYPKLKINIIAIEHT